MNMDGHTIPCIQFKGGQSADGQLGLEYECCQTLQRQMSALEPTVMLTVETRRT